MCNFRYINVNYQLLHLCLIAKCESYPGISTSSSTSSLIVWFMDYENKKGVSRVLCIFCVLWLMIIYSGCGYIMFVQWKYLII